MKHIEKKFPAISAKSSGVSQEKKNIFSLLIFFEIFFWPFTDFCTEMLLLFCLSRRIFLVTWAKCGRKCRRRWSSTMRRLWTFWTLRTTLVNCWPRWTPAKSLWTLCVHQTVNRVHCYRSAWMFGGWSANFGWLEKVWRIFLFQTLNFDVTVKYLELVAKYVSLMIILSRIEDRKAILGLYTAVHELINGKA